MQPDPATTLVETTDMRDQRVTRHIREAAEATGVPFDYLLAQANQESRLNPNARSSRSSAQGLYQFTASTWLAMIKAHGAEHGLGAYADAITKDSTGRYTVINKELKKEILDLRRDSKVSALMAGEYAADNRKVLEGRLGRKASSHDLYLAHFLGAGGALRVIQGAAGNESQQVAAGLLPAAARANPEFFQHTNGEGEAKSVTDLYQAVSHQFRQSMAKVAPMARRDHAGSVDLAALRPEARPVQVDAAQTAALAYGAAQNMTETLTAIDTTQPQIALAQPDLSAFGTFPVRLPPPLTAAATATTKVSLGADEVDRKG